MRRLRGGRACRHRTQRPGRHDEGNAENGSYLNQIDQVLSDQIVAKTEAFPLFREQAESVVPLAKARDRFLDAVGS